MPQDADAATGDITYQGRREFFVDFTVVGDSFDIESRLRDKPEPRLTPAIMGRHFGEARIVHQVREFGREYYLE